MALTLSLQLADRKHEQLPSCTLRAAAEAIPLPSCTLMVLAMIVVASVQAKEQQLPQRHTFVNPKSCEENNVCIESPVDRMISSWRRVVPLAKTTLAHIVSPPLLS